MTALQGFSVIMNTIATIALISFIITGAYAFFYAGLVYGAMGAVFAIAGIHERREH